MKKSCRHCGSEVPEYRAKKYDWICNSCRSADRKKKYTTGYSDTMIKWRYKIDDKQLAELKSIKECQSCGDPVEGFNRHIDHCHASGEVRGILCGSCNRALGMLKDCPNRVSRLLNYVANFNS